MIPTVIIFHQMMSKVTIPELLQIWTMFNCLRKDKKLKKVPKVSIFLRKKIVFLILFLILIDTKNKTSNLPLKISDFFSNIKSSIFGGFNEKPEISKQVSFGERATIEP